MAVCRAVSTPPQFGSGNQACSASRVGIVSQVRKVGDNRVVTAFLSFSYHLADATLQYLQFKCCVCCQCTADCIYGISLLSFGTFLAWKVKHRSLSIIYLIKSLWIIYLRYSFLFTKKELGDNFCRLSLQTVSSVAQSCPTLCNSMNRSMPGLPVHHQLPEFTQTHIIKSVMPSSHLILCRPLLLLSPIPPSIRDFSNESTLRMRWPKYWSFSFSISPSNGHPGLISFRMDWLDLLAAQGTLKSLLQHHSSKASIL